MLVGLKWSEQDFFFIFLFFEFYRLVWVDYAQFYLSFWQVRALATVSPFRFT